MKSIRWIIWSLAFFGLGVLARVSAPSARAVTGSCPAGYCDATADEPTYIAAGCAFGHCKAHYGGNAEMITGTAYGSCGNMTTAGSQVGLYQAAGATAIDVGATNNIMYCGHLDCDDPLGIGYHRQTPTCVCVANSSYYCIYSVTWFSTVFQNGCTLAGFSSKVATSHTSQSPKTT